MMKLRSGYGMPRIPTRVCRTCSADRAANERSLLMKQGSATRLRHRYFRWCLAAVCSALTVVSNGCGPRDSTSRYTPSSGTAREALDKALAAWQRNDNPDQDVAGAKSAIRMVDGARQGGQKLTGYEITSETPAESPARFSVRLHLENPTRELEANYVVVGNDPIWVFREEEYTRQQGM